MWLGKTSRMIRFIFLYVMLSWLPSVAHGQSVEINNANIGGHAEEASAIQNRFLASDVPSEIIDPHTNATEEKFVYTRGKKLSNATHARHPTAIDVPVYATQAGIYAPRLTKHYGEIDGVDFSVTYSNFADSINPHTIHEIGTDSTRAGALSPTRFKKLTYFPRYESFDPLVSTRALNIVSLVKTEQINNSTQANRNIIRTFTPDNKATIKNENRYGVVTSYTYHSNGELASETDANNNVTYYASYYRGTPRIIRESTGLRNSGAAESKSQKLTKSNGVDFLGQLTSTTDNEGNTTSYEYDRLGRLELIKYPRTDDANLIVSWNAASSEQAFTRGNHTTKTTYDGFGREYCRQLSDTTSGDLFIRTTLNALGNRTFISEPHNSCSGATKGAYYHPVIGRLEKEDTGAGDITYNYLDDGVVERTDEVGNQYTYSYRTYADPRAPELMRTEGPLELTQAIQRNELGLPTAITLNGQTRTYAYGGANNANNYLSSEIDPELGTTTYGTDNLGNVTSKNIGADATTSYVYDNRNRLKTINYPSGTPDVSYTYFRHDLLKSVNNGIHGANKAYTYDKNQNLQTETHTIQGRTYALSYTYNDKDQLATQTYPDGELVSFAPNRAGWPTRVTGYINNVSYNAFGQPEEITHNNGRKFTQTYDTHQRPWVTTVDGNIASRTRTYYASNNLSTLVDSKYSHGSRTLTYDALDRLDTAQSTWAVNAGSLDYDLSDNLTKQTFGTKDFTYTYDNAKHRLSSVTGLPNFIQAANYEYDARGNIEKKGNNTEGWLYDYSHANNLKEVTNIATNRVLRRYDYSGDRLRIRGRKYDASTGELKEDRVYIHSHAGKVVAEHVVLGEKPSINYVHLGNRLVAEVEHRAPNVNGSGIKGYGYGNSQYKYGYTHTFTLDKLPRDKAKVCVKAYAISTNEIRVSVNGTYINALPSGNDGKTVCMNIPLQYLKLGDNTLRFDNPAGSIWGVSHISFKAINTTIAPILKLLLGKQLEQEHPEMNTWARIKTASKAIIVSSLMAIAPEVNAQATAPLDDLIDEGATIQRVNTVRVTHIHTDADGSPFAATDSQGNLEWRRENYPYGDKYKDTNVARTADINFAGKAHDEEIGLSYFGARWYDPQIGRFTGIDAAPVQAENWKTFNRYSYGFNNPYKYVDPDGNEPEGIDDDFDADNFDDFEPLSIGITKPSERDGLKAQTISGGLLGGAFGKVNSGSKQVTPFFPVNNGFIGKIDSIILNPGQIIDRFGLSPASKFFSPAGTPAPMRALPPGTSGQPLVTFEVLKPFPVQSGLVAPAFNQIGLGTQFKSNLSVGNLKSEGFIKEVK